MDFGAAFERLGNAQAEQSCKDGHAAIAAANYPRAVGCFQRCVQIEPSKVYLLALAQAHETNGQPEEAVAQYHATLGVDPNFYGALQGLARLGVAPLHHGLHGKALQAGPGLQLRHTCQHGLGRRAYSQLILQMQGHTADL